MCALDGKEMESINDVFVELLPLKAAFPVLVRMIQIVLTIVVSTAECEQFFLLLGVPKHINFEVYYVRRKIDKFSCSIH